MHATWVRSDGTFFFILGVRYEVFIGAGCVGVCSGGV